MDAYDERDAFQQQVDGVDGCERDSYFSLDAAVGLFPLRHLDLQMLEQEPLAIKDHRHYHHFHHLLQLFVIFIYSEYYDSPLPTQK